MMTVMAMMVMMMGGDRDEGDDVNDKDGDSDGGD